VGLCLSALFVERVALCAPSSISLLIIFFAVQLALVGRAVGLMASSKQQAANREQGTENGELGTSVCWNNWAPNERQ